MNLTRRNLFRVAMAAITARFAPKLRMNPIGAMPPNQALTQGYFYDAIFGSTEHCLTAREAELRRNQALRQARHAQIRWVARVESEFGHLPLIDSDRLGSIKSLDLYYGRGQMRFIGIDKNEEWGDV